MSRNSEDIRLRVPLTKEQYREASKGPKRYRDAMMAQPALEPAASSLPLRVAPVQLLPGRFWSALWWAHLEWNQCLEMEVFRWFGPDHEGPLAPQVVVNTAPMDWSFEPSHEFGGSGAGFLIPQGRPSATGFGSMEELGECVHYWGSQNRAYSVAPCVIRIAEDLTEKVDLRSILMHELGHALLLGHDPDTPGCLMYRKHGTVMKPKPIERRWVREIWSQP